MIFLETKRLRLRRFAGADADLIVELDSDPDVMHFITGGRGTPREEVIGDVLPNWLRYYDRYAGYGFFAAELVTTGEFLGWFHLRPEQPNGPDDEPELGYRLKRSAWGQGYASEGSKALLDKAFGDLGASRVFATTMAVNVASRRVMENCGMRMVREFHQEWPDPIPGDEHGDVEYAITREEWSATRGLSR